MPAAAMTPDMSWLGVLEHHARSTPTKPLCVFEGDVVTYEEMAARSAALAAGVQERGVGAGDVVALLSYNCTEFLESIFAANYLGAIAMPINWRLAAPEVRYILEHSQARALVCDHALVPLADDATDGMEQQPARVCIATTVPAGWTPLADLRTATHPARARVAGDEVHRLM